MKIKGKKTPPPTIIKVICEKCRTPIMFRLSPNDPSEYKTCHYDLQIIKVTLQPTGGILAKQANPDGSNEHTVVFERVWSDR